MKFRKFVDKVNVHVLAGHGGNGCASFRKEKFVPKGGPDGGDGGRGGHVIFKGSRNETSLIRLYFAPELNAEKGGHGKGKKLHGKNGKDLIIEIPCGTEIHDQETKELLADITEEYQTFVVAKGGAGGKGNCHWTSSTNRAPRQFTSGKEGEEKNLRLTLKLIADIGLVGLPNAGKSSLVSRISHAHPKVAAYPFTTLNPIIGTMVTEDYSRITIADVPGIIKGAHDGVGLGHDFLRHIERSRFLLFVIDIAGVDGRNPAEDYRVLIEELEKHKAELVMRPSLIVANKIDLPEAAEKLITFEKETGTKPIAVSTITEQGIDQLRIAIQKMTSETNRAVQDR